MTRSSSSTETEAPKEAEGGAAGAEPQSETLGAWLARERTLRDVSLEEIAEVTKIPLASLRALEADAHRRLPAPAFVKGFLRAYSRHVGLESDQVILRYEEALRNLEPDEEDQGPRYPTYRRGMAPLVIAGLVLLAILGTAGYFLYTFYAPGQ